MSLEALISDAEYSKLRWRCRRGLLENDLFLERFFDRHAQGLSQRTALALGELMTLGDNDLLDLHLQRKSLAQVDPSLDTEAVREVLSLLRKPPSER